MAACMQPGFSPAVRHSNATVCFGVTVYTIIVVAVGTVFVDVCWYNEL